MTEKMFSIEQKTFIFKETVMRNVESLQFLVPTNAPKTTMKNQEKICFYRISVKLNFRLAIPGKSK